MANLVVGLERPPDGVPENLGVGEGGAAADVVDDDAVGAGRVNGDVVERRANDDLAPVGSKDGDRDGQIGCGTWAGRPGRERWSSAQTAREDRC